MLRRIPSANNGSNKPAAGGDAVVVTMTGGGFGTPTFKAFKPPSLVSKASTRSGCDSSLPPRKRKRISYKEDGGQADDRENEYKEDGPAKKYTMGNKEYGADGVLGGMGKMCNRKFPVFEVKPKEQVFTKK